MSCFENGQKFLNLFATGPEGKGLYENQKGAIGAAMSHFSVTSSPALITMPTGTGKTAVMIILSYLFKAKKVLVLTPSQLVRKQIAQHFREQKLLIHNKIVDGNYLPTVYELTNEETSAEKWKSTLDTNDVIVAIPKTLSSIINTTDVIPNTAFDLVFVDEAHHSRAPSWVNILEYFQYAKEVLLTATPFRRDKKDLKARLIYNFPLKRAVEEGLFSKIEYKPVVKKEAMTESEINIEIAKATEEFYINRKHPSHKIIIRTDSKNKAIELDKVYKENTGLKLSVIHSDLTERTINTRIEDLTNGRIDGIICVDMMGEGYDFPALKIAAIHVPHKSLAITLQFVGRLSRTNIEEAKIATVIASDHDFLIESAALYRENTDWSIVLPDLHKHKIGIKELEQKFEDSFEDVTEENSFDLEELTPLKLELDNLRPFFHVKIYRTFPKKGLGTQTRQEESEIIDIFQEINFETISILNNPTVRSKVASKENNVMIYVLAQRTSPSWLQNPDKVYDLKHELLIIYYNLDNRYLFICSTVKETDLYEYIAESLISKSALHEMVHLPHLKRVMAGWQNEKLYNIGMKSRKTKGNEEAYKQLLGPLVQKKISPGDKLSYTRGHSFGGAFDTVLKKEVLLGISTSSKIWSLDEKKVVYLIEWCSGLARKIGDPEMDALPMPLTELDSGQVIEAFSDDPIFFADWSGDTYSKNLMVAFLDEEGTIVQEALLYSCDIKARRISQDILQLSIIKGDGKADLEYRIDPTIGYKYSEETQHKLFLKRHYIEKDSTSILNVLKAQPISIFYETLSFLSGKVFFEFKPEQEGFSGKNIWKTDWSKVEVTKEYWPPEELIGRQKGIVLKPSIHEFIIDLASAEFEAVYYDHASLEIADVICFKSDLVRFYHCKSQFGKQPRCTVEDMYEVIGQAVKSVVWSNRKLLIEQLINRSEKNKINEKLKKGSIQAIKDLLNTFPNPSLPIEIVIVQPGLKTEDHLPNQAEAFRRINRLLAGAEEYLKAISGCTLKIMTS